MCLYLCICTCVSGEHVHETKREAERSGGRGEEKCESRNNDNKITMEKNNKKNDNNYIGNGK